MLVSKTIYFILSVEILFLWLVLNLHLNRAANAWRRHWRETTGRIVRFNRTDNGTYPLINYIIAGTDMRAAPLRVSGPALSRKVGDTVTILYDPQRPNRFLIKEQVGGQHRLGPLFFAGTLVLSFILMGHYMGIF